MRYTREDYEHRHCLAISRTESGEFVKCLICDGDIDADSDAEYILGPAQSQYSQTETDDAYCPDCGDRLIAKVLCYCNSQDTTVRQFETGEANIHPDDIEKGVLG